MDHYPHTIQTWNKLASLYEEKFMDVDLYNDTYDLFCDLLTQDHPTIFEIGCGPGNITRYLHRKKPGAVIEATDVAPAMVELAQQNVPSAYCHVMDCRDIGTLSSKYNGIICGFCLPYLVKEDALKLVTDGCSLLHPGGIFYISAIEGPYESSKFETSSNGEHTMFIYYHQEDYLREALEDNGCEVVQVSRKVFPKADGSGSANLILIAQKK